MRFGFVTCVELGAGCIEEIYRVGGRLNLIITLDDDRAQTKSGRVSLDAIAARHAVPLVKVSHINEPKAITALQERAIDWLFIIGWSQIAGTEVLDTVRRGAIGMHPTLLPVGRGRAPIPWAILLALPETGVTMFQLDEGVDTGPIIAQEVLPLDPDETATRLYERVARAHRHLIAQTWDAFEQDNVRLVAQDESRATTWAARRPADGELSQEMEVGEFDRLVRATTRPYPGAFLQTDGGVLRIWSGRPQALFSSDREPGLPIRCADGWYVAREYVYE